MLQRQAIQLMGPDHYRMKQPTTKPVRQETRLVIENKTSRAVCERTVWANESPSQQNELLPGKF